MVKKINCGFDPVPVEGLPAYVDLKEAATLLRRSVRAMKRIEKLGLVRPTQMTLKGTLLYRRSELLKILDAEQRGEGLRPRRNDATMG